MTHLWNAERHRRNRTKDPDIEGHERFPLGEQVKRSDSRLNINHKIDDASGKKDKLEREIFETRRFDREVLTAARSLFPTLISLSTKPKRCVYRRAERPGDIRDAAFRPRDFNRGPVPISRTDFPPSRGGERARPNFLGEFLRLYRRIS